MTTFTAIQRLLPSLVLIPLLVTPGVTGNQPRQPPLANGTYKLITTDTNSFCIDVYESSNCEKEIVQQFPCHGRNDHTASLPVLAND